MSNVNEDVMYLQKVVNEWNEFCRTHKKFERSIQNILIRNFMLETENEDLRFQLNQCQKSTNYSGRK